ncbi:MAG: hypothetical protein Q9185_006038 [Variospora sp. 1 TL-2023]
MTKRRISVDERVTGTRPRKRVAFTKAKASTKAIIARNAAVSPLLRLPSELRDKIWTYVLGDRLVHLDHRHPTSNIDYHPYFDFEASDDGNADGCLAPNSWDPWQHIVCQHDCPEDEPDKKVALLEGDGEEDGIWVQPHDECYPHFPYCRDLRPHVTLDNSKMHLTVLCASRQIYVEANRILWATNTFSFGDGVTLKDFMKTRNAHQKRLIHNLRFDMHVSYTEEMNWNSSLNMALVRSLTGVQTLRLKIAYDMEKDLWDTTKDRFLQQNSEFEGLRKLSILPLTSAEVVVRTASDSYARASWQEELWQQPEMDECAKQIRQLLLNPQGADIYAQRQAELVSFNPFDPYVIP